ncbi:hypothetical protein [Clostridium liquoris]|nr:hypothetical protein [Clostridium liquoris]
MYNEKERLLEYLNKIGVGKNIEEIGLEILDCHKCCNGEFMDYTFIIKKTIHIASKISDSFYGYTRKKNDKEGYHLGCTLPIEGIFFHEEYDRCSDAIELYSTVYGEAIFEPDKKNNDKKKNDSKKDIICFKFQNNNSIEVSGDVDFNFKMEHVRYLSNIVENSGSRMDKESKRTLVNRIFAYNNLTYTPANISLFPVTGGLNNIKKSLGNDRLDTFLCALNLYFEGEYTSFILSGAGGPNPPFIKNRNKLKEFLDNFNDIDNYCNQIYHIDRDLVHDLCSSGAKPIDTAERVEEYLDLADKFWQQKENFYKESNTKIQSQYQKMLKMACEARGLEYKNTFTGTQDYTC